MSIKRKLFASVAAPVLSLPLLIQPVYAIPPGFGNDPSLASPGIIRVQQEVIPEEAQEGEKPKRREQQAEQPEGEQPKRREQHAEQPAEQPRQREQQNAEQPEAEQPKRREQRAQEEGGSEQPKRRQQQAEQPAEQPQEQPRQREQQNAEQPEAERPKRREQRAQEEGGEKPRQREQQAEQPKPAEEPAKQKADQAPEPKETETKKAEPKQAEPKPAEPTQAEPKQAEPTQRQAEEPKPRPERQQNAEQPAAAETPQRNAEQPQGERPRQREQQAGEGQGGERPRRGQQAQDGQPASGTAAPDQATSGGERQPQPAGQQQAEQPATLPVENGAAVLDSAKEQRPGRPPRDGERPRRDPNREGGQQAPGQQPAAQQAQEPAAPPPRTDADAQANDQNTREQREQWRNQRQELVDERGERMDRRPDFERPRGWDVRGAGAGDREPGRDRDRDRDRDGGRVIISIDDRTIVRHDDSRRFYEDGRQPEYERLGDGRFREVVERGDGTRVVTIRNRYGEVVQRSRVVRGGEEYVLYYAPELLEDRENYTWRDPGDDLPPMRLGVPIDDYIIDTSSEPDRDYYQFLEQPPVERVERPYSLDEVRYSARIRDKVPRIDLDTITFATGSAEIPMNQASSLRKVADAINKVLQKDPAETFLIEGHTDAVGSDDSNLVLSDRRAESVAVVLSDAFNIPPENLTTQGYGEQYLKVNTEVANQENRRVTIRRITPLVKPVASKQ